MRRWQAVLLALVVGSVMAFGMPGLAQDAAESSLGPGTPWPLCWMFCPTSSQPDRVYQYSVKVVQGRTSDVEILGPGQYTTSVNIHNPWCHSVKYQVKLALADRNSVEGAITLYSSFTLGPDGVTEFDSVGFRTLLNATLPAFFEGYFVIQCEEELDVVAVYAGTVEEQTPHGLSTIETERVPARMVPRGRDLSANISTGVAPWVISSVPPVGSTLTAGLLAPISNPKCGAWVDPVAANVQWGAVWVGESNCTWTGEGIYTYDYTFDLCCGFHDAKICFRLWADNNARVFLNDMSTPVTTVAGNFGATAVAPIYITSGFLVGPNLLRIEVENMNPTNPSLPAQTSGMMLDGRLCVEAGICP